MELFLSNSKSFRYINWARFVRMTKSQVNQRNQRGGNICRTESTFETLYPVTAPA